MATKQEGSSLPTEKQRLASLSNFSQNLSNSWIGRNWQTVLVLAMLVFLALFVRSYFAYSTSVDNGYLVSGGSDSYYHMRVINHAVATGDHLVYDNMLNYPWGMRNPRPPLYDWSVAVFGMVLSTLTGLAITDAIGLSLVFSTAVWGALTVIPVYMLGKAAFGKKAGMLGAFIFALMAGHIERTVLSNADHDAMVLFFVVFAFYFLLRSLQSVNGSQWVTSWKERKAIGSGLKGYLGTNQASLIYAALGGMSMAAVALIWTGYTYLLIIIFVYFIVQLLVDRFRNADSMGVLFTIIAFFGTAFLVMAPTYVSLNLVNTWFDTPVFLFIVAVVGGLMFVVTRDYPWTLVLPVLAAITVATLAVLSVLSPSLFESIITGQGYLVKSKLYSTISEAQAPNFSTLAMSFGMVTFWLSLIGIFWAAIKIPKNISPYFIFVVVWVGVSIYMASSAARFVFNASPAFAISAGWVLGMIIERLKFDEMIRSLRADHGGFFKTIRQSVKLKHVLGALFIVMMILVPNVWYALDASIPSNTKTGYDMQIYTAIPDFMKPSDYDTKNGTYWYLGAFTYGMTETNEYWPVAWKWFSEQDSNITTAVDRPAFLSWWDYGFEAIEEGAHPSVADNFQNGYAFAGSFLMCQTEDGAIALLIVRCVEGYISSHDTSTYDQIISTMQSYGVNTERFVDIINHPANYKEEILANPSVYGEYDSDLSDNNAMYAATRVELCNLDQETLVLLYNDVREITGNDIGYISVDSRLFPFSATSSNIFYAPAKLADQRLDDSGYPYDYYTIYAVDYYGNKIALNNVTSSDYIVNYEIDYTEAFYNTMLYRTFMGYGPSDVGQTEQGIPGISGSLKSDSSMQGWNMTNFRMVYRTAYYNPFPSEDVANHTDAWRAVSYEEAIKLYYQIYYGEITGTVDLSSSSLYSGVVFLQYYDGAIIQGTAVSETGEPMSDLWVTVYDEYGIPHQVVKTDENGHYNLIAPFGQTTVVFSYGDLDATQLVGTELYSTTITITYDQAMRVETDANKDGQLDYLIDLDAVITAATLDGQVYLDVDGNGKYSATTDQVLVGATVTFENETAGYSVETITTENGYELLGVTPMNGTISVEYNGHVFDEKTVTAVADDTVTTDLYVEPASITGVAYLSDGSVANGVNITLVDQISGGSSLVTTNASGGYSFENLLPGNYTIQAPDGSVVKNADLVLAEGDDLELDLVLYESMRLSGIVSSDGQAISNAMIGLTGDQGTVWVLSDSRGRYSAVIPKGNVTVYATATVGGTEVVYLAKVLATDNLTLNLQLGTAVILEGTVQYSGSAVSGATVQLRSVSTGAIFNAVTNSSSGFRAVLPSGLYFGYMYYLSRSYWGDINLNASVSSTFNLISSATISGTAWYDEDANGAVSSGEALANVRVTIKDSVGREVSVLTDSDGRYSFVMPTSKSYTLTAVKDGYETLYKSYSPLIVSMSTDLNMVATERQVSGSISETMSGMTVVFTADSDSAISKTTTTAADGSFYVDLSPGDYTVEVDQNVTAGDGSVRYQTLKPLDLTVSIGQDPEALSVEIVERYLVAGTVSPSGTVSMVFDGMDITSVSTTSAYSVYLQEGNYSLYVRVDNSSQRSAYLGRVLVSGPMTLDVAAETAYQTIISVSLGNSVRASVNVAVDLDGAYYNVSTSSTGRVTVVLAPGDYTAFVAHHTIGTINSVETYVVYKAQTNFTVANSLNSVAVTTTISLDNATVEGLTLSSGTAIAASIQFQATSEAAMDLTVDAPLGNYSVQLAPGNYSVYALSADSSKAFLGTLIIDQPGTYTYDMDLVKALRLSGVTFANDEGSSAELIATGEEAYAFSSDADGSYEVYLPAGTYALSAQTTTTEAGVAVTYLGQVDVVLEDVTTKGVTMEKVVSQSVDISWDSTQKATLSAGETAIYTIRVVNKGNVEDTFAITSSSTGWTIVLSETEVTVGYGSTNSQVITVQITPSSTVKVSHSSITIKATSTTNSSVYDSASIDAIIRPSYAASLAYVSAEDTDGSSYIYTVELTNDGNVKDTYTVTIGNQEALEALGWEAKLVNTTSLVDSLSLTVAADYIKEIQVSLVPIRENPSPSVSVQIVAVSSGDSSSITVMDMEPEFAGFSSLGGLTISGDGVSDSTPAPGDDTIILLGVMVTLMVLIFVISVQKGVFSRRKR
ncbi:MAG: carboxypeptidase regulatory-like domain-containing protein [Methanomassiliicoccales archaeon]|nr:carboxypeptidase regulatory-like domain-containing protein [Methanomassiliicoccales archaeon]